MTHVQDGFDNAEPPRSSDEEQGGRGRSRLITAMVVLLLLLMFSVATAVNIWVERTPDEVRFVTRNLGCLECHTEYIPEAKKTSVHSPFLLNSCLTCHTPHGMAVERTVRGGAQKRWQRLKAWMEWMPLKLVLWASEGVARLTGSGTGGRVISEDLVREKGAESELTMRSQDLCWICHGDMGGLLGKSHPHAPFAGGYCTNCHDPHASDNRVLLKQDERDLCLTCHPLGPELARKQVHPPVKGRHCTNCHDPHSSDWKGILVDNQRDLCFVCHPSVAPLSLKPVQHAPFQHDNCTGCHEPHGSNSEPLLISEQPDLCYDCHPVIEKDFLRPSHHPIDTVKLDCAGCHDPHGADYPALLTAGDNEMCYECHRSTIGVTYEDSKHKRTTCVSCHTPHGSDYSPMLQDANPQVCFRCHPRYDEAYGHPVRPAYWDAAATEPLTCTSTCHTPHGSPSLHMMAVPYKVGGFGADNLCLQCHKRVGVDF